MSSKAYTYTDGLLGHQSTDTSREAAARGLRVAETKAGEAYRLFERAGTDGLTDDELARDMGEYPSARPRRIGLFHKKLIVDGGMRRKTRTGSWAVVWEIAKGK